MQQIMRWVECRCFYRRIARFGRDVASRRLADVDLGVEACFTFAEIQIFPPKGEFRYADSAKLAFHAL